MLTEFGVKITPSTYYAALPRPKSRREIEDENLMIQIGDPQVTQCVGFPFLIINTVKVP